MSRSVAYLVSKYPAVSHTFIRREVEALRARGIEVTTYSLRRAGDGEVLSDVDRRERDATFAVLPVAPLRLARAHAAALVRRPGAYARTLRRALAHRMPGARAALWATFHFAEAIVLAEELERRGVTHVHNHFANAGGEVGFLATRFLGLDWSLTLHGAADFDGPTRPLLREKIAATRFTACVTDFGRAQAMRAADPATWDRIVLVRCGLDLTAFPRRDTEPDNARFRILTVGRLSPEKGQMGLIEAAARLRERGVAFEVRVVGDGPERPRLEREIGRRGLGGHVTLVGALAESGVRDELRTADAFAMTSFMEGLPVVLMEAMAIGVPVVAPRITGIPELIEHGVTGSLYTPARWDALTDELVALALDRGRRRHIADAARARLEVEFTLERSVEPLRALFDDGASDHASGSSGPSASMPRAPGAPDDAVVPERVVTADEGANGAVGAGRSEAGATADGLDRTAGVRERSTS